MLINEERRERSDIYRREMKKNMKFGEKKIFFGSAPRTIGRNNSNFFFFFFLLAATKIIVSVVRKYRDYLIVLSLI